MATRQSAEDFFDYRARGGGVLGGSGPPGTDPGASRKDRLMRIIAAIADAVAAEEVYEAVVDQVVAVLDGSSAGLWLVDEGGAGATLVRSVGYTGEGREAIARVSLEAASNLPVIDAMRTGAPVWIPSQAELLEAYPHLASVVSPGRTYRISCLPIVVHGQTLGAIGITFDHAPPIDAELREFLMLVVRYCGQALERLRLLEYERRSRAQAESAATRMGVLSRASGAFSEAGSDLSLLLQAIVEQVTLEHSDMCGIFLVSARADTLEVAAVHHRDPEVSAAMRALIEASPPRMGEGLVGRVAVTGESVLLSPIDGEAMLTMAAPVYREWLRRYLPRSMLVVPLRARGRNIGVLSASRLEGARSSRSRTGSCSRSWRSGPPWRSRAVVSTWRTIKDACVPKCSTGSRARSSPPIGSRRSSRPRSTRWSERSTPAAHRSWSSIRTA
jgi:GAF domain-containing protein